MRFVRVIVLTTRGPCAIVYLGRESAASGVRSAIRIDGDTASARISPRYEPFVDVFVQRHSAHRVYRADVSGPIEEGDSWQLGFLIAHRILENPALRLATDDEPADVVVYASGVLKDRPAARRVDVRRVEGIEVKLATAHAAVEAAASAGAACRLVLPAENRHDVAAAAVGQAWPSPVLVEDFAEVEALLEELASPEPAPDPDTGPLGLADAVRAWRARPWRVPAMAGGALIAAAALFWCPLRGG